MGLLMPGSGGWGWAVEFSKLPPFLNPHSVQPSLSCSRTSRCVYVFHHLPFSPHRLHWAMGKRRGARGLGVTHSGSPDRRGPGLFVLVSWPAVSCLVRGYMIRTAFPSQFGAVRGEKKDPRLRMPRPGLSALICYCCCWEL